MTRSSYGWRAGQAIRALGVNAGLCATLFYFASTAEAQNAPSEPEIESLGGERYRIGKIVVDKSAGFFLVPGRVLVIETALEYFAVTVGGTKGYESLLELDASATEFNLACILIGLTNDEVVPPDFQFDPDEVVGPGVRITAQWEEGGETVEVNAGQLIVANGEPGVPDDWVYFGSTYQPGSQSVFSASVMGTLIGLAHDPASIIEHRTGVGIGNFGSIVGNRELLGIDMQVTLRIEVSD